TTGNLGYGDTINRGDGRGEMGDSLPVVDLGTGLSVTQISGASTLFCARISDGTLRCWGANTYGQLGVGDTLHRGDGANEMGDSLPALILE
ncbi:MAG: RCC1 domain-containing protein, partial [Bdellovibrionota bacterium]